MISVALPMLHTSFPSPDRGVWHLGPIPIRAYALCIIAGIIVAIWLGERRWQARGGVSGTIVDVAVFAVPFGLIGGRLYHVITDYYRYFGPGKNPIDALKVWDGGLGIWGAIALGGVGALIACRRRKIPLPAVADAVAPGIVLAQAIGRLGNYFNQELYGGHTTLPWGMQVFTRLNPDTGLVDNLNGVSNGIPLTESPVHPTFLYELIWNIGVALLVLWADRRFRLGHGRAFALYVAGYTAGRFWIELMRDDPATHVLGVRVNVWVAALVFLGAVAYMYAARGRGEREDPASLVGIQPGSAGQAKATDTETDDAKTDGAKADDAKAEEPKADGAKADDAKAEEPGDGDRKSTVDAPKAEAGGDAKDTVDSATASDAADDADATAATDGESLGEKETAESAGREAGA